MGDIPASSGSAANAVADSAIQEAGQKVDAANAKLGGAQAEAEALLRTLNEEYGTNKGSLEEMKRYLEQTPYRRVGVFRFISTQGDKASVENTLKKLADAQHNLSVAESIASTTKDLADSIRASADELSKMLKTGNLEGAIMLIQSSRVDTLDRQIEVRIQELQARNAKIAVLNNELAELAKAKDDNKSAQKRKTEVKGEIDKLNGDSQLDMIKLQSLTNKRNQAFDLLTNLVQKFAKNLDNIIGNMR